MQRLRVIAAASAISLALVSSIVSPAGASDGSSVRSARARVERARAEAAEAAQAYLDAMAELATLDTKINALEERIPRLAQRVEELEGRLHARAALLYRGGAEQPGFEIVDTVIRSGDLIAGRRVAHLAGAAQADLDAQVEELAARRDQLENDRTTLRDSRARQQDLVHLSELNTAKLNDALERANGDLREAEQREALTRYFAAVAAQQAAADAAALAAAQAGTPPPPDPREQTPPADPALAAEIPVDAMICPIDGVVTFADDWGQARSGWRVHQGTDVFAARGTPNLAIADGVAERRVGGLGGNAIWLHTDDGHAYYYAHLDGFEGVFEPDGTRRVVQGEVVGYVGNTGNAAGGPAHTHFEIRPRNIGPINPYPLLRTMCAVQGGFVPAPEEPAATTTTTTTVPATTTTP